MTLIQVGMHLNECILDITPGFPRVPLKLRMDISRQETHIHHARKPIEIRSIAYVTC